MERRSTRKIGANNRSAIENNIPTNNINQNSPNNLANESLLDLYSIGLNFEQFKSKHNKTKNLLRKKRDRVKDKKPKLKRKTKTNRISEQIFNTDEIILEKKFDSGKLLLQISENDANLLEKYGRMRCIICFGFFNNPVMCKECEEIYCENCIYNDLNQHFELDYIDFDQIQQFKCPHCRKKFHKVKLQKQLKEIINKTKIICPNEKQCGETFELEKLKNHLETCENSKFFYECKYCKKKFEKINPRSFNTVNRMHFKSCREKNKTEEAGRQEEEINSFRRIHQEARAFYDDGLFSDGLSEDEIETGDSFQLDLHQRNIVDRNQSGRNRREDNDLTNYTLGIIRPQNNSDRDEGSHNHTFNFIIRMTNALSRNSNFLNERE